MGERIVVIDADIRLPVGVEIAGWRLERPPPDEFERLAPPGQVQRWDSATRSGRCCMLRRPDPAIVAPKGLRLPRGLAEDLSMAALKIDAWAPLLLLNLWTSNDPVQAAVEYDVDPGRYLERARGGGLGMLPVGADDEDTEPQFGPLRIGGAEQGTFLRFLQVLGSRLPASQAVEASAVIFLPVGGRLGSRGDVTHPRERPEVIFRYVAAVEHLLVGRTEDGPQKATYFAERTATLIAGDADRSRIVEDMARAYRIRNSVAHGGPAPAVDAAFPMAVRDHVRRVFARLIVLGPDFRPRRDLAAPHLEDRWLHRIRASLKEIEELEEIEQPAAGAAVPT